MQLFLIRHPRPLIEAGVCYGQFDVEAEDPRPLAARLRSFLPPGIPVIASPLRRARRLAQALHPQAQFDQRLMEIDFGDWEGKAWEQIDRQLLDAWAADMLHFAPPGGESAATLQARVIDCVTGLRGQHAALVTHAGAIRAVLGHWLRLPIGAWSRLALDFGSVTLLEIATTANDSHAASRQNASRSDPVRAGVLHYRNRQLPDKADANSVINHADGAGNAAS